MTSPRFRLDLLTSPGLIASLAILLVNDFVLKPAFHNWLTGKLSDFAGLFAFALFWISLAPRHRVMVLVVVAAAYAFWESVLSQPLIDLWNGGNLFGLSRVVDYTDLAALTVLPLAGIYSSHAHGLTRSRAVSVLVGSVSVFAFVATSAYPTSYYFEVYTFPVSEARLEGILDEHGATREGRSLFYGFDNEGGYRIALSADQCRDVVALVRPEPRGEDRSVLVLARIMQSTSLEEVCNQEKLQQIFESTVMVDLRSAAGSPKYPATVYSGTRKYELMYGEPWVGNAFRDGWHELADAISKNRYWIAGVLAFAIILAIVVLRWLRTREVLCWQTRPDTFAPSVPPPSPARTPLKWVFSFEGRTNRFGLMTRLVAGGLTILVGVVFAFSLPILGWLIFIAAWIVTMWMYVAGFVKRFHDLGRSGEMIALLFIPLINWFVPIYLLVAPGNRGPNRFGEKGTL